jgi:hypothetical protein
MNVAQARNAGAAYQSAVRRGDGQPEVLTGRARRDAACLEHLRVAARAPLRALGCGRR